MASGFLLPPSFVQAQPQPGVYRVGVIAAITTLSAWRALPNNQAFLEGLRQLGYVEGQNLAIELRSAEGKMDRLPEVAAELVGLRPAVILVSTCGAPLDALRHATRTIPIVVAACTADMVASGIVASLAHPGGNITGQQKLQPELAGKRLALIKEAMPNASRIAVLWDPGYSDFAADWGAMRTSAQALGLTLRSVEARTPEELEGAFSAMVSDHVECLRHPC